MGQWMPLDRDTNPWQWRPLMVRKIDHRRGNRHSYLWGRYMAMVMAVYVRWRFSIRELHKVL